MTWAPEGVIVAVVGLVGILAGQANQRRMHREDYMVARDSADLAGLRALVDALTKRVSDLEDAVRRAEEKADAATAARHDTEARLWHAVAYTREALTWGRDCADLAIQCGAQVPPEPAVPAELDNDL